MRPGCSVAPTLPVLICIKQTPLLASGPPENSTLRPEHIQWLKTFFIPPPYSGRVKVQSAILKGPQLARVERQLEEGSVPADVFVLGTELNTEGLGQPLKPPSPSALQLVPAAAVSGFAGGLMGGLFGLSVMPPTGLSFVSPAGIAGAAVGAAIGIGFALEGGLPFRGKTEIELDGEKTTQKWKGRPELRAASAPELKARLTAEGALGDSITPVQPQLEGPADLNSIKPYNQALRQLAQERRLVADLDSQSRYGKPALQLVDSSLAAQLLARGQDVYAVNVTQQTDVPHVLKTNATSSERSEVTAASHQYVDRQVAYELSPVTQVVAKGQGLPEGIQGVLKDERTFTQPVLRQVDAGHRHVTKASDSKRTSQQSSKLDPNVKAEKANIASKLSQAMATSTRPAVISAGLIGGVAAGLAGAPPVIGLVAGGALGHLAGRAALAAEPGSGTRKMIRGALGAGGAIAGAALGLHAGLHGGLASAGTLLAAGIGAGAWGGLCAGALWDLKRGKSDLPSAQTGFVLGAGLGLATAMSGNLYLGVATAVLGAVGGACLSRLAPN